MTRPYVIGLTGNIACGKTLVLDELRALGAETIDADRVAHGVMQPGGAAYQAIVDHFGPEIVAAEGTLDRRALGAIVFNNPQQLDALERLTHPATVAAIRAQVARSSSPVAVIDAIKLFEAGLAADCDQVWVVRCEPEQQLARLMRRNNFSHADALTRINAQPPQEEKLARADRVIDNSGSLEETLAQVRAAWAALPLQPNT
ncbi:MAG TPA: dephospho-CoA kinase [Thermomicrobiaceae bacterium]|nr:dephospho-CoA kinase [Thermomicrobiaceae bacterium]